MTVRIEALAEAIKASRLPTWDLAAQVGADLRDLVSPTNLNRLPVGVLMHIAALIDLPLNVLFGEDAGEERSAQNPKDVPTLGACFAEHPDGLRTDVVATVLEWDLDRLEAALGGLDRSLALSGLRLVRIADRVRITGRPGRCRVAARAAALTHSACYGAPLDGDVAAVVWWAAYMGHGVPFRSYNGLSRAYSQRLLIHDDYTTLKVAEEVAFSLMLSECRP